MKTLKVHGLSAHRASRFGTLVIPFLHTRKAKRMTTGELAGGSLAIAHGALHLRIYPIVLTLVLGTVSYIYLLTHARTAVGFILLAVLLVPHDCGKTEEEGDSEWVELLKVHHLVYVNKLFFYRVGIAPFYTSM
tara:strand:+ start:10656 stop:11057 length:402 start_codon:yes stop_codon:yes gene_type:complete